MYIVSRIQLILKNIIIAVMVTNWLLSLIEWELTGLSLIFYVIFVFTVVTLTLTAVDSLIYFIYEYVK